MEHLTKQQIVLLTLLVSFVTSIATGIVAVSLIDQAPPGVTRTINQIVERTVQEVSPDDDAAAANTAPVTFEDETADATAQVSKSIVRIKPSGSDNSQVTGIGLIVSSDGVIVTDKATVASLTNPVAVFSNGQEIPIQSIQSQINGDITFVIPLVSPAQKAQLNFVPISFAPSIKLGQTVFSLSGNDAGTLAEGIISHVQGTVATTTSVSSISTTIPDSNVDIGSPVFSITGDVIGIKTSSLSNFTTDSANNSPNGATASFYPLSLIKSIIPATAS